ADETRPLNRLAREAARAADADAILAALRAAIEALISADLVIPLSVSQDGSGAVAADGEFNQEYLRFGKGPSGTARVLATGRSFAVSDARTSDQIVPGRAERHGVESTLFTPVEWSGNVRYVLLINWRTRRDISQADVDLAELAADQAAAGFARLE